ncbi:Fic family protein [Kocuria arenosa]|uniref:Fic family protein n=1 Tax=Kocuria arenosa TaxID=3071446 RepID=UPI0034D449C9
MTQPRQPRGTSGGGRFAAVNRSEAEIELGGNSWPGITYEERAWNADPVPGASRRQRLLARGPYQAAVLEPIADLDPVLDTRTQAVVEQATVDMVRFDRDLGAGTAPFASLLLRSESAASSQIEHLTAGSKKIALAQLGDTSSGNARLIVSNVAAMNAAVELSEDLSVDSITEMHRVLMADSAPQIAGQIRDSQVWIRGNAPHAADFVPPHHERVPVALDDLARFVARDDLPAVTQAVIAHAQFETIHPFADGNGRTGRALVGALLRNKNITEKITIPVSSGLLTNTQAYFDALTTYRQGNPQPIVELFAESSFAAMANGRQLAEDLEAARADYTGRLAGYRSAAGRQVVELLMSEPAVNAEMVRAHTGASESAVYRVIDQLVESEVLAPAGKVRGAAVYIAPQVIEALDAFAIRAGRRQRH